MKQRPRGALVSSNFFLFFYAYLLVLSVAALMESRENGEFSGDWLEGSVHGVRACDGRRFSLHSRRWRQSLSKRVSPTVRWNRIHHETLSSIGKCDWSSFLLRLNLNSVYFFLSIPFRWLVRSLFDFYVNVAILAVRLYTHWDWVCFLCCAIMV